MDQLTMSALEVAQTGIPRQGIMTLTLERKGGIEEIKKIRFIMVPEDISGDDFDHETVYEENFKE